MVKTKQSPACTESRSPLRLRPPVWIARWVVATVLLALSVAPAQALLGGGTYVATGPTVNAHTGATLTLLQSGKVLIAGSGSAELYDPATGTWSATGNPTA